MLQVIIENHSNSKINCIFGVIELAELPEYSVTRRVFFYMAENTDNTILSLDEQIDSIEKLGFIISDIQSAKNILRNISYFRLLSFSKIANNATRNPTFQTLLNVYSFDSQLRTLLFELVEKIEVSLRTKLGYYISIELNSFWYEQSEHFHSEEFHSESLNEIDKGIRRSKESFIKNHFKKYGNSQRPPAYMICEILSFGTLSKLYSNLNNNIASKKKVAREFGLPNSTFLRSWLQTLNILRNVVAHQNKLLDRYINLSPKFLFKSDKPFITKPQNPYSIYHSILLSLLYFKCYWLWK